jgi:hypothetical protein
VARDVRSGILTRVSSDDKRHADQDEREDHAHNHHEFDNADADHIPPSRSIRLFLAVVASQAHRQGNDDQHDDQGEGPAAKNQQLDTQTHFTPLSIVAVICHPLQGKPFHPLQGIRLGTKNLPPTNGERDVSGYAEGVCGAGGLSLPVVSMAKLLSRNSPLLVTLLVLGLLAVCYGGIFLAGRPLVLLGASSEEARDKCGIDVNSLAPKGTRVLDVKWARSFMALRGKCPPEVADDWMEAQIKGEQMVSVNPATSHCCLMKFSRDEPYMEFTTFYKTDPQLYTVKGVRRFKYVGYHEPSQTWFWLEGFL